MDMSDDILGLVLERVGPHVSLIRAAAVCKRWRRAIADAAFLRRYRALHSPAFAGYYHHGYMGGPVFVPSAPSMVDARHFSLDFLPGGAASWLVSDSRGSLLLVGRFPNQLVCEPVTRRYTRIPLPPAFNDSWHFLASYLLDGEANEADGRISMSNFRVLLTFDRGVVTRASMFTVNSSWSEKNIDHIMPSLLRSRLLGRAGGSWYFSGEDRILINLDGSTGEFSSLVLPAIEDWDSLVSRSQCFFTDGRDGKPRIFTVVNNTMKVFERLDGGDWALEKRVLLSEATRGLRAYQPSVFSHDPNILTRGAGFVILSPQYGQCGGWWPFSIDLETMDAAPVTQEMGAMVYQCEVPWPPALHACLDR